MKDKIRCKGDKFEVRTHRMVTHFDTLERAIIYTVTNSIEREASKNGCPVNIYSKEASGKARMKNEGSEYDFLATFGRVMIAVFICVFLLLVGCYDLT